MLVDCQSVVGEGGRYLYQNSALDKRHELGCELCGLRTKRVSEVQTQAKRTLAAHQAVSDFGPSQVSVFLDGFVEELLVLWGTHLNVDNDVVGGHVMRLEGKGLHYLRIHVVDINVQKLFEYVNEHSLAAAVGVTIDTVCELNHDD
jgi:hypothetical protein